MTRFTIPGSSPVTPALHGEKCCNPLSIMKALLVWLSGLLLATPASAAAPLIGDVPDHNIAQGLRRERCFSPSGCGDNAHGAEGLRGAG